MLKLRKELKIFRAGLKLDNTKNRSHQTFLNVLQIPFVLINKKKEGGFRLNKSQLVKVSNLEK